MSLHRITPVGELLISGSGVESLLEPKTKGPYSKSPESSKRLRSATQPAIPGLSARNSKMVRTLAHFLCLRGKEELRLGRY